IAFLRASTIKRYNRVKEKLKVRKELMPQKAREVMGVTETATPDELTKIYRDKALVLHPDKPTGSMEKFEELGGAYEYLMGNTPEFQLWAGVPVPSGKEIAKALEGLKFSPEQIGEITSALKTGAVEAIPSAAVGALTRAGLMVEPPITPPVKPPEAPPEVIRPEAMSTQAQKAEAHIIAKERALITPEGKTRPGYRRLAKAMTGKTSMKDMTREEADSFINSLKGISEPYYRKGKLVPPSIPKTTAVVPQGFFQREFKEPTIASLFTSQTYYSELLGVKPLVEPLEVAKQKFDLEYRKQSS
ncbi:unnamed protein product, partial [marine sediment metagenome]